MPHHICCTCGTRYPDAPQPPPACLICTEPRQYVPPEGQLWTTMEALAHSHRNTVEEVEPGLHALYTVPHFAIGQRAFVGRLRAIDGVDVRDLLPRVGVPLLYLQATRDRLVLPRFGREVTAGARDGRLIRLDGAHMLLQTAPQACWEAIASELYDRA